MAEEGGLLKVATKHSGIFATTFIICTSGLWITGDWLIISTAWHKVNGRNNDGLYVNSSTLKELLYYVFWATAPALVIYAFFCSFLKWKYYYRQADRPEDWKCQPRKFLSWEDEKNEIFLGVLSLTIASFLSGLLSWYIAKGGYTTMYFEVEEYGWAYFLFTIPLVFCSTDFGLYWAHRIFHKPLFYRHIHKYHHRYKQPTPYSFSAMHPIEMITYQSISLSPIFIVPVHWAAMLIHVSYAFYYGVLDHSGIKMEALWPWQPNTTFHDNHHQYFHCNFGFNTNWFDRVFGTIRRKDRVYNESTFYGAGKSLDKATKQEMEEHVYNIQDDKTS